VNAYPKGNQQTCAFELSGCGDTRVVMLTDVFMRQQQVQQEYASHPQKEANVSRHEAQ
jgi:hypothetical protein